MSKRLMSGLVGLCLIATGAWAADPKDPAIAPGTVITAQNWQKYKDFFPIGLQTIFQGNTIWSLPQGWELDVGPTVDYPLPKRWWNATEKYKNQARLAELPTTGYAIQGYNAGTPFPDYSEPEAAYKLLYDIYYHYQGTLTYYTSFSPEIDRYLNTTTFYSHGQYMQFTHIVDPEFSGWAQEMPGYFASYYDETLAPEQIKYTSSVELVFDDPNTVPEFYAFVPSLRRSLRISGGARCAPYAGTDYVGDDILSYIPLPVGWFNVKFQGQKKMLLFRPEPGNLAQFDEKNFYTKYWFPKPAVGKWQVFNALVLDIMRVPTLSRGYCYGLRRMYIDPRSWNVQYIDLFDGEKKFWKMAGAFESPHPVPGGGYMFNTQGVNWIIDFQNGHASEAVVGKDAFGVNEEVPKKYWDVSRYGSPAGLQKIMQ